MIFWVKLFLIMAAVLFVVGVALGGNNRRFG